MNAFDWIVAAAWVFWVAYWIASARDVKKDASGYKYWQNTWWVRVLLVVATILILQLGGIRVRYVSVGGGVAARCIGIALLAAGIFFAVWARRHLGKNWSNRPALKEGHELITSGPYRIVRHPIYAGVLAGMLGTVIVEGGAWVAVFAVFAVIFIWRVPVEERIMMRQFPDQYPKYKERTKALIPLVW